MNIRYFTDPDTGLPHIYGHGVTEREVQEVFRNSRDDIAARNNARFRYGPTDSGRHLKIIYSEDDDPDSIFVITAYNLEGNELRAYRRRRRRKQS